MDKTDILNILGDWNFWRSEPACGIPRDRYLVRLRGLLASRQVVVITGPRRAGKSFLMRQLARSVIRDGLDSRQTLFVNFEDPRWPQLDTSLLERIFECYLESIHREGKPLLLLDEIQEVEDWEKWVRMAHERHQFFFLLWQAGFTQQTLTNPGAPRKWVPGPARRND